MKVLTFNRHESFLLNFARAGSDLYVLESTAHGENLKWNSDTTVQNIHLIPFQESLGGDGFNDDFEWIIFHTLMDFFRHRKYLKNHKSIFIIHLALYWHSPFWVFKSFIKKNLLKWLKNKYHTKIVSISVWKKKSWGLSEVDVIENCSGVLREKKKYGSKKAVCVGNHLDSRVEANFSFIKPLLDMTDLLGDNPSYGKNTGKLNHSDLIKRLKEYDIFVSNCTMPWEDGYNLAMLEAMSLGLAIICLKHPYSLVEEGQGGFQVRNAQEARTRISQLQDNPDLLQSFGAFNQRLIEKRFSTQRYVSEWQSIIKQN